VVVGLGVGTVVAVILGVATVVTLPSYEIFPLLIFVGVVVIICYADDTRFYSNDKIYQSNYQTRRSYIIVGNQTK